MASGSRVWGRIVGQLLLVGVGLLFGLLIVELFLRAVPSVMPSAAMQWYAFPVNEVADNGQEPRHFGVAIEGHPELNYLFRAGVSTTGEYPEYTFTVDTGALTFGEIGFRDDGIDEEPYAVAVGDSFVLGWGVESEETWVELLEARLGRDVANMGVMGGTTHTTAILTEYGLSLDPDLVLYGFFPNDMEENARFHQLMEANATDDPDGYLAEQLIAEYPLYRLRSFLSHNLYTYRLASYFYYGSQGQFCSYRQDNLNYEFDIEGINRWLDLSNPGIAQGWEMVLEDVRAARQAAETNGAVFVLLIFPTREYIYPEIVTEECDPPLTSDLLNTPIDQLESMCEEEGMYCFNLIEAMRTESITTQQIFFPMDGHWNVEGNRIAADLIYAYLVDNDLLPEP